MTIDLFESCSFVLLMGSLSIWDCIHFPFSSDSWFQPKDCTHNDPTLFAVSPTNPLLKVWFSKTAIHASVKGSQAGDI